MAMVTDPDTELRDEELDELLSPAKITTQERRDAGRTLAGASAFVMAALLGAFVAVQDR